MQCNICRKEFGEGVNCQHCGVDRVTGLGGYHGYTPTNKTSKDNDVGYRSIDDKQTNAIFNNENLVCYACGEIIPADSDFCPVCGQKLYVVCPSCGSRYSSKYEICNKCGTNRIQYEQQRLERERIAKEERIRKEKEVEALDRNIRLGNIRIAEEKRQKDEKERRKKKEAEKKQKEIEDRADMIIRGIRGKLKEHYLFAITYAIVVVLVAALSFYLMIVVSPRWILLFFLCLFLPFGSGKIQEYIKDNPNDPVNSYLKKVIE